MHDLIDGTVDWNKENLFGAICDWHVPGLVFTFVYIYSIGTQYFSGHLPSSVSVPIHSMYLINKGIF